METPCATDDLERMSTSHEFGRQAEQRAAEFLESRGWTVLHRNWRWRRKEIDLIARRGDLVAFVEVKARQRSLYGHPLNAITWAKRRELQAAARAWIAQHARAADSFRFDVVWVLESVTGETPQHEEDAWHL
jgi:putative endonuclease